MVDLLLYMLAGISVGMLTGLFPALPVYTGPFLLYHFHQGMSLEELLVFWLTVYAGSQFFGSIATITTNIPGEESSLVYLEDLKRFNLQEKNFLLYDTALGSFIAAALSSIAVWYIIGYSSITNLPFLYSVKAQIFIYGFLILSFLYMNRRRWLTVTASMIFGLSIAPGGNYALPPLWYDWQFLFEGYTFYLIILGTLIIPNLTTYSVDLGGVKNTHYTPQRQSNFKWWEVIKATGVGFVAGLIPGPSAEVAAIYAYRLLGKGNTFRKIVAAETANNAAVIAASIPFFILALPINHNTALMSGIMDMHGLTISEAVKEESLIFYEFGVYDVVFATLLVAVVIYYLLSVRMIDYYVKLIVILHSKLRLLLITLLSVLIYLDIATSEITAPHYFILLLFFTAIGFILKRLGVSAVPMMFSIMLGDQLIWASIQVSRIYF